MSVAFTSDAKARWAAEWLTWPQFGQFWAQVVRHALRKAEAQGTFVAGRAARAARRSSRSTPSSPSGRFLNALTTELTLVDPGSGPNKVEMAQVAPGRYQAEFDVTRPGSYQLMFSQTKDTQVARPADARACRRLSGRAAAAWREYRAVAFDRRRRRAAGSSPQPESVFDLPRATAPRAVPLWPYLAAAAVLFFVLDVALRRIDLALLFANRRRVSLSTHAT